MWTCRTCTLENTDERTECAACDSARVEVSVVKLDHVVFEKPLWEQVLEKLEQVTCTKGRGKRYTFTTEEFLQLAQTQFGLDESRASELLQKELIDLDRVNRKPYVQFAKAKPGESFRFGKRYFVPSRDGMQERRQVECQMCSSTALLDRHTGDLWVCQQCTYENKMEDKSEKDTSQESMTSRAVQGISDAVNFSWSKLSDIVFQSDQNQVANKIRAAISEAIITYGTEEEYAGSSPTLFEFLAKDRRCRFGVNHSSGLLTVYGPIAMKSIRSLFHITEDFFAESLLDHELVGQNVGGGRSGAMLLYSKDRHFVVKSLVKKEASLLHELLPELYQHYVKNPDTLLPRVYGLYKIDLNGVKRYFLVTNNVFDTILTVDQVYDLKGSTANRFVDSTTQREHLSSTGKLPTLKDLNWKEPIVLPAAQSHALIKQIELDTEFLANHNLMDYSLLVGVHLEPLEEESKEGVWGIRRNRFQETFGGLQCTSTKSTFFIALIDVLQEYDMSKAAENFVKTKIISTVSAYWNVNGKELEVSCTACPHKWKEDQSKLASAIAHAKSDVIYLFCPACHTPVEVAPNQTRDTNISSIEPSPYRSRFLQFVSSRVLGIE